MWPLLVERIVAEELHLFKVFSTRYAGLQGRVEPQEGVESRGATLLRAEDQEGGQAGAVEVFAGWPDF